MIIEDDNGAWSLWNVPTLIINGKCEGKTEQQTSEIVLTSATVSADPIRGKGFFICPCLSGQIQHSQGLECSSVLECLSIIFKRERTGKGRR